MYAIIGITLSAILLILLVCAIVYGCFAFIEYETDPSKWDFASRLMALIAVVLSLGALKYTKS
jgi:uncharacterized protein (DUF983 family)